MALSPGFYAIYYVLVVALVVLLFIDFWRLAHRFVRAIERIAEKFTPPSS